MQCNPCPALLIPSFVQIDIYSTAAFSKVLTVGLVVLDTAVHCPSFDWNSWYMDSHGSPDLLMILHPGSILLSTSIW